MYRHLRPTLRRGPGTVRHRSGISSSISRRTRTRASAWERTARRQDWRSRWCTRGGARSQRNRCCPILSHSLSSPRIISNPQRSATILHWVKIRRTGRCSPGSWVRTRSNRLWRPCHCWRMSSHRHHRFRTKTSTKLTWMISAGSSPCSSSRINGGAYSTKVCSRKIRKREAPWCEMTIIIRSGSISLSFSRMSIV